MYISTFNKFLTINYININKKKEYIFDGIHTRWFVTFDEHFPSDKHLHYKTLLVLLY